MQLASELFKNKAVDLVTHHGLLSHWHIGDRFGC